MTQRPKHRTAITHFHGENFYPAPVEWDGEMYPTVEHASQAAKTLDADEG